MIASVKADAGRKTLAFDHGGKPRPELKLFGASWKAEFSVTTPRVTYLVLTGTYENRPATGPRGWQPLGVLTMDMALSRLLLRVVTC